MADSENNIVWSCQNKLAGVCETNVTRQKEAPAPPWKMLNTFTGSAIVFLGLKPSNYNWNTIQDGMTPGNFYSLIISPRSFKYNFLQEVLLNVLSKLQREVKDSSDEWLVLASFQTTFP